MGWDKGGRYYTRSKKVNGRVAREYIGIGEAAELAAKLDHMDRLSRRAEADEWRAECDEWDEIDDGVQALIDVTDRLARAALVAAGYRQHHRGEWRKSRAKPHAGRGAGPDKA